jgi:hypothetical protein
LDQRKARGSYNLSQCEIYEGQDDGSNEVILILITPEEKLKILCDNEPHKRWLRTFQTYCSNTNTQRTSSSVIE